MTGSLTLRPMGEMGQGGTFCLKIALILDQSVQSKQVSWSLQCQETHSGER